MYLQPGTPLQGGKYRIKKFLGQGGFGITYLAEHTGLHSEVAIKEFFMKDHCNRDAVTSTVSVPSVGSNELVRKFKVKFLKEAQMIAEMDNRHIIKVIDVFEAVGNVVGTDRVVPEFFDRIQPQPYLSDIRKRLA